MITVLYFAWLRERVGSGRETVETTAGTAAELIDDLVSRDDRYARAFANRASVRVALDQVLSDFDAPLSGVREVAFFPPMTGG